MPEDGDKFRVTIDRLVRRVVLEDYVDATHGGDDDSDTLDLIARKLAELHALAMPGDEWWEWMAGDHPLRMIGGLALLRDGIIMWDAVDWLS